MKTLETRVIRVQMTESKDNGETYTKVEYEGAVEVSVDLNALFKELAQKALRNKGGVAKEAGGALVARVVGGKKVVNTVPTEWYFYTDSTYTKEAGTFERLSDAKAARDAAGLPSYWSIMNRPKSS